MPVIKWRSHWLGYVVPDRKNTGCYSLYLWTLSSLLQPTSSEEQSTPGQLAWCNVIQNLYQQCPWLPKNKITFYTDDSKLAGSADAAGARASLQIDLNILAH